jgi:IS30 family transposase
MTYRHLDEKDRFYIEQRLSEGCSIRGIARELGFSPSMISREIKRHTPADFRGLYCHRLACRYALEKRANAKHGKAFVKISEDIRELINKGLSTHSSPEIISKDLMIEHGIQVSESTLYRYIHDDRAKGGRLYKNLPHSGKPYKKSVKSNTQAKIPNRIGIENRPAIADQKVEFGHFEIDTIVGKEHKSYLLTLVDKANKMCCIRKMPNKKAETVVNTFSDVVESTFFDFKTITSDNGTEFSSHMNISEITGADFYFARPYRSCDRGLNEHTNGLIRRFLPKGTDFNEISDKQIATIEHILNSRRGEQAWTIAHQIMFF